MDDDKISDASSENKKSQTLSQSSKQKQLITDFFGFRESNEASIRDSTQKEINDYYAAVDKAEKIVEESGLQLTQSQ